MTWKRTRQPAIASLMRREVAAVVDSLPFLLLTFLTRHARNTRSRHRCDAAITVLDAGYTIGLTTWFGRTPGQMLVGISVVDGQTRKPPRWSRSAIRWTVASLPYPLVTLLPVLRWQQPRRRHHQFRTGGGDEQHDDERELDHEPRVRSTFAGRGFRVLSKAFNVGDFLLAMSDPERRGMGDRASGTVVVEAPRRRSIG